MSATNDSAARIADEDELPPPLAAVDSARRADEYGPPQRVRATPPERALDVAGVLARVGAPVKRERHGVALEAAIITFAAGLRQDSREWATLVDGLRVAGVKVREWSALVRGERATTRDERRQARPVADTRPDVVIHTDPECLTNDDAVRALAALPALYQRGWALVEVLLEPDSTGSTIRELPLSIVRENLTRAARFVAPRYDRESGETTMEPAHPPDWCSRAVFERGRWEGVRHLRAVVQTPTLRRNGTVLDVPGYDAATGLLYEPTADFPRVADNPTAAEVRAAVDAILYVVKDVPFADGIDGWRIDESADETRARLAPSEHCAAWVASLLTPFARHCADGTAPMFVYSANVRGAGKGLLKCIVETTCLGRAMQFMVQATERDAAAEDRKRITSMAISGEPMVVIDNARAPIGNGTLEAAITSPTWGERILGESTVPRAPLILTWYATGNNVVLAGDMPRRCLVIHLDSPYDKPEGRDDYTEKNLEGYVARERPRLVWACLTILRAWTARGMNDVTDPGPCSFPGWSRIVRGAIIDAGLADPWLRNGALDIDADEDAPAHAKLVIGWASALAELGRDEVGPQDMIDAIIQNDDARTLAARSQTAGVTVKFKILREALAEIIPGLAPGRPPNAKQLGRQLALHKSRSLPDGRRLARRRTDTGSSWRVEVRAVPRASSADDDIERDAIRDADAPPGKGDST